MELIALTAGTLTGGIAGILLAGLLAVTDVLPAGGNGVICALVIGAGSANLGLITAGILTSRNRS